MAVQIVEASSLIADQRLRDGYAYWCRKATRRMPRRADVDPTEMPHLLPHIRLVDVVAPGRFRYRLVGTEARLHHLTDPTGRFLDEVLSPPAGPRIVALHGECVRNRRPLYAELEFNLQNGSDLRRLSRVLYTPLSEDGDTVSQLLVFHVIAAPFPSSQVDLDLWALPYRELVHTLL
jgi:hypothetical protein